MTTVVTTAIQIPSEVPTWDSRLWPRGWSCKTHPISVASNKPLMNQSDAVPAESPPVTTAESLSTCSSTGHFLEETNKSNQFDLNSLSTRSTRRGWLSSNFISWQHVLSGDPAHTHESFFMISFIPALVPCSNLGEPLPVRCALASGSWPYHPRWSNSLQLLSLTLWNPKGWASLTCSFRFCSSCANITKDSWDQSVHFETSCSNLQHVYTMYTCTMALPSFACADFHRCLHFHFRSSICWFMTCMTLCSSSSAARLASTYRHRQCATWLYSKGGPKTEALHLYPRLTTQQTPLQTA